MLTGVLPGTLQSSAGDENGAMQRTVMVPEDLSALADQVLAGLRAQLADSVWAGLRQLLAEQEQRLLAALASERSPSRPGSSAAAGLSSPVLRLSPKSLVGTSAFKSGRRVRAGTHSPTPRHSPLVNSTGVGKQKDACDLKHLEDATDNALLVEMLKSSRRRIAIPTDLQIQMGTLTDEDMPSLSPWSTAEELNSTKDASTQIQEFDRPGITATKAIKALEPMPPPPPLRGQLLVSRGSAAELPRAATPRPHRASQRNFSNTISEERCSIGIDLPSKEQALSFTVSDEAGSLPSVVQMADQTWWLGKPEAEDDMRDRARSAKELAMVAAETTKAMVEDSGDFLDTHTHTVRQTREAELLDEIHRSCGDNGLAPYSVQSVSSPLPLCLCGILRWGGQLGAAYRFGMAVLAGGSVVILAERFHRAQSHMSSTGCAAGICMQLVDLSDLLLAVGSFLGLVAVDSLRRERVLGSPEALLPALAIKDNLVPQWSSAVRWQSLYLAIMWLSSLACRAVTVVTTYSSLQDVGPACAFVLMSSVFMGLAYSILYVNCLICIVINSYGIKVKQRTNDLAWSTREWDKLGAMVRRVSRTMERGFLIFQLTAVSVLLCSFGSVMLYRDQEIWRFVSNGLLAQSLILVLSKTAEVTELCQRMPATVNCLDFDAHKFSLEKHYLVEHITYSASGFYLGEVRLTAVMGLKFLYVCTLLAFGVLSHFA